jgi:hypothetical protein
MVHEPGAFTRPRMTYGKRNTRGERVELLGTCYCTFERGRASALYGRAPVCRVGGGGGGGANSVERRARRDEHHQLDHRCREARRAQRTAKGAW